MQLTLSELQARGLTPESLAKWVEYVNQTTKAELVWFKIAGPVMLPVRRRPGQLNPKKGPVSSSAPYAFIGSEPLKITSMAASAVPGKQAIKLAVGLTPAPQDLKLTQEISGLTLSVDDAILHLEGFKDWLHETMGKFASEMEKQKAEADQARADAEKPAIVTQEQFEQSEEYGAW